MLFACCISTVPLSAEGTKLGEVLRTAPPGVNSVGYLNPPVLKRLMAEAGLGTELSDRVQAVWVASRLDILDLVPQWEVGEVAIDAPLSQQDLVQVTGGYLDRVGERDVVWTPRQAYLIPLSGPQLAFVRPANRVLLAEWLAGNRNPSPSPYLIEQTRQSEDYLSLLLAIDLQHAFSPVAVGKRLAGFESLRGLDAEAAADVLASIRGLTILVGRRSLQECILTVDFQKSPEILVPRAGDLLSDVLDRNGTSAPEVKQWAVTLQGNELSLRGPISEESLDGLLGVFSLHGQADQLATPSASRTVDTPAPETNEPNRYESKAYFDSVLVMVEKVRKNDTKSTGNRAKWNDPQARRIDELATLRVDPGLVQYGSAVA